MPSSKRPTRTRTIPNRKVLPSRRVLVPSGRVLLPSTRKSSPASATSAPARRRSAGASAIQEDASGSQSDRSRVPARSSSRWTSCSIRLACASQSAPTAARVVRAQAELSSVHARPRRMPALPGRPLSGAKPLQRRLRRVQRSPWRTQVIRRSVRFLVRHGRSLDRSDHRAVNEGCLRSRHIYGRSLPRAGCRRLRTICHTGVFSRVDSVMLGRVR
jgi:hypothetical protein